MTNYNDMVYTIVNESLDVDLIHEEEQLRDSWLTKQQAIRDEKITKLLDLYVGAYEKKVKSKPCYQKYIMIGCALLICASIIGCGYITINVITVQDKGVGDIVALVTGFTGVLGSLAGIVQIITKYVFPENEEQYITEIVKAIQTNDLENKKVNIRASNNNSEE
ncbi:MAG: hypothetical protein ACI4LC_08020 [Emergencia sp.]